MRLLFIESDKAAQRWIASQADGLGVEIAFVPDYDSLAVDETLLPHAVVMDVTSCGQLRGANWNRLWRILNDRSVPLLVYSSSRRLDTIAEFLGQRCNGYLARPFTLRDAVRRAESSQLSCTIPETPPIQTLPHRLDQHG